ncbi:MBL fold metallo-hydrolase [Sporosarcina pasteurii]|uniref:Pyrroloquinoline quinone biosynthesis protein B n=1 Tax=Sporosarcina pasteurii TaxID=1474 RepID=A0A380BIK9_SPOPA|nr:MBL fold metallo-hydrolase [Sporosarcina pasteurii]MDS9470693.1 MBL fold metallo-hydrolase [Sporosarcina pasteurii]QBQ05623.1 pyrroloquinoline quinone biosynthesis protein PqqB [Sporosarcina pasteurii]SUJ01574.1 Pyrroloquinoline quinone biosynthesis protein B [Sporosarcina pasteurii]
MSKVILTVIGTAQDAGLPHPNCFCKNCSEAMQNPKYQRHAASLAIVLPEENAWHLIDATPDLKEQMANVQIQYNLQGQLMESIFLTHAHLGHYPGLLFLGREAIGAKGVPVFAGNKMKKLLEEHAPWSLLTKLENIKLEQIEDGRDVSISPNVSIKPVEVPHRNEFTETFGFWIKGPNKKVLYIPDIDQWHEWDQDIYDACKEADICLLDSTFYSVADLEKIGRSYGEIPHPLMTETMDRLQDLVSQTEIYFTHFNHSNPALDSDRQVRKQIEEVGFHIADEMIEFIL